MMKPQAQRLLLFAAVVIFVAGTGLALWSRLDFMRATHASFDRVINVAQKSCENREALTHQYRVRGEDLRDMARLLAQVMGSAARVAVNRGEPVYAGELRASVPLFRRVSKNVRIIPEPRCVEEARELRKVIPPG